MAVRPVRDVITYAHVREVDPGSWVDVGLSARTPAPGVKQALLAARRIDGQLRKWLFAPGTRMGEPVSVLVTIELTFTLR